MDCLYAGSCQREQLLHPDRSPVEFLRIHAEDHPAVQVDRDRAEPKYLKTGDINWKSVLFERMFILLKLE